MDENNYIKTCLKLIEQKLGWPDRSTWVYDDFRRLQEMILEVSGTSLSVHTLERLFGKLKTHKNYNPQKETKNALAVFLGYENWKHFRLDNSPETPGASKHQNTEAGEHGNVLDETHPRQKAHRFFSSAKKTRLFLLSVGIIVLATLLIINFYNHAEKIPSDVNFKASNVFGVRPHTVKFSFDLSDVQAKDISIAFGIGRSIHHIPKDQTHLYKTYLSPGIYNVQLKADGKPIATKQVFIAMKDWEGYTYSTYEDVETQRHIPDSLISKEGKLYTPPSLLNNLVEADKHFFVEYFKVDDFKVDGDNMTFATRFKNNHKFDYQICYDMWFKLIGTDGVLKMHFLRPGCAGFVQMIFSENSLNGHKQDLSAMTREFDEWKRARMEVKNKQVRIFFEDQLIYTTSYDQPIGKIYAISITSKGTGQTDYVRLYNNTGEMVYSDNL